MGYSNKPTTITTDEKGNFLINGKTVNDYMRSVGIKFKDGEEFQTISKGLNPNDR